MQRPACLMRALKCAATASLALLASAPSAKADPIPLHVTSGLIDLGTGYGGTFSLFGDDFSLSGYLSVPFCRSFFPYGGPIEPCGFPFPWYGGQGSLTRNGVEQGVILGDNPVEFDYAFYMTATPMFPSGATQAILTEPASLGPLLLCDSYHFCGSGFGPLDYSVGFGGDVTFTIGLLDDPALGGYDVTSENFTITTPEPGTLLLLCIGLTGLIWCERRSRGARRQPA